MIRDLVIALLDSDTGIDPNAWEELTDYLQCQGEFELIGELARIVKIAEGGGSVPEGNYFINRGQEWQAIDSWGEFHIAKVPRAK